MGGEQQPFDDNLSMVAGAHQRPGSFAGQRNFGNSMH